MQEVPIVIEGQAPSSGSVKLNTAKANVLREIVKKESKTVPRKGVFLDKVNEKSDQNDTLTHGAPVEIPVEVKVNTTVVENNKQSITNSAHVSTSTEKVSTERIVPVREESEKPDVIAESSTSKTTRKPKPKPIVTVGGKEADEPIPATPTNKSPLGMPRKIDYIVPVVITLTALPLLGVLFFVLYKRGRDYWDKRHYRRMDFLIDGMYNE